MSAGDAEQSCDNPDCDRTEPLDGKWTRRAGFRNIRCCGHDCLLDYFNNHHPDELTGKTDEQTKQEGRALAEAFGPILDDTGRTHDPGTERDGGVGDA